MTPADDPLSAALQHHQAGRLDEAEVLYRGILKTTPDHAPARHMLGVLMLARGEAAQALDLIDRALTLDGGVPEAHFNRANVLLALKRPEDATRGFVRALELRPDYPDACFNLGRVLSGLGRDEDAVTHYRRALDLNPAFTPARFNLANALLRLKRFEDAANAYGDLLKAAPENADILSNLGRALIGLARLDDAEAVCRQAVAAAPDLAQAHAALGEVLRLKEDYGGALECQRKAADLTPGDADPWVNLGGAYQDLERFDEAEAAYRRAIGIDPGHALAHANLGTALHDLGRMEGAEDSMRRAIEINPQSADAHYNLGNLLHDLGRLEEAEDSFRRALEIEPERTPNRAKLLSNLGSVLYHAQKPGGIDVYRKALALDPDLAGVHVNLAFELLRSGRLEEGWPEFEWRWYDEFMSPYRREYPQPQWRGEDFTGKTLLIHAEQGHGDTLQFARYVPLAAARGGRVVLECQPALRRLMSGLDGAAQVIATGEQAPGFDLHCPLMSLPAAFATTLETVPAAVPFLSPQAPEVETWRRRLGHGGGVKVGLVWAGESRPGVKKAILTDRRRSLSLEAFRPLAGIEGIRWISLQMGPPAEQITGASPDAPPDTPMNLLDPMGDVRDFADTAALIHNLDLVISVDTAVPHLSASQGVPTWILSRYDGCWRWLLDRDDSPWYPGLRLFRQPQWGDWKPVIEDVRKALAEFVAVA